MNAEELLEYLLDLKGHGTILSNINVIAIYNNIDPSIPYDTGEENELYIDECYVVSGFVVKSWSVIAFLLV